jgi:hypothetical protein
MYIMSPLPPSSSSLFDPLLGGLPLFVGQVRSATLAETCSVDSITLTEHTAILEDSLADAASLP